MMLHYPFNPECDICVAGLAKRRKIRRQKKDAEKVSAMDMGPRPENFGDQITFDHIIERNKDDPKESVHDEEIIYFPGADNALVGNDRSGSFLMAYPRGSRTTETNIQSFKHFVGPKDKVGTCYTDNAPELKAACLALGWRNPTSTPGVHETNGLAERVNRKVRDGTRASLKQAGLIPSWWVTAIIFFCMA